MKVVTICIVAVALMVGAAGNLSPPERSFNILMLLPVSSKSHRNVFISLAEALTDRGHKIVMLTGLPPSSKNPNIYEINHGLPYFEEPKNMFEMSKDAAGGLGAFKNILPAIARELYKVPAVKQLYEKRKDFDLIVVHHLFNEPVYPFVHEVPFIMVATPGMDPRQSAVLGNVLNPSYAPSLKMSYPFPMSMWQRIKNTAMHIFLPIFWRNWAVVPLVEKEVQRYRVSKVGIIEGSVDDAARARRLLDGVRDPPPRGAAAEVPGHPTVLGGVPATGRGGPPPAGATGAAVSLATPYKESLDRPLWQQR